MIIRSLLFTFAVCVSISGCWTGLHGTARGFRSSGAIDRAAFEMDCPKEQLKITELGNASVGVSGCGKKQVYVDVLRQGWVLNSDQRPSGK